MACRADAGLIPGDGSTPGRVRMLGAIMADPEPFSCWKKGWLISAGNVSQAAAAKKRKKKKRELEIFQVRCSKMV